MPIHRCKTCTNEFYVKPSHEMRGWGLFCSRGCKHIGTRVRETRNCHTCGLLVYKTLSQIKRSKSNKFFCGKSCQTKWRNVQYVGSKHLGWKGKYSMYRELMLRNSSKPECCMCKKSDVRILAVHHIDQDRLNMKLDNLQWLCHNCHYLVHRDKLQKLRS